LFGIVILLGEQKRADGAPHLSPQALCVVLVARKLQALLEAALDK
jgi:hypothetical protein